jgi:hypothetical protein
MATFLYWIDPASGLTEAVQFDVTDGESPEDVATPTDHAVERGANISDHLRKEPAFISVEGTVSAMPNPLIDTDVSTQQVEVDVNTLPDPGSKTIRLTVPSPPLELSQSGLLQAGIGALTKLITGAGSPQVTVRGDTKRAVVTQSVSLIQQTAPRDRIREVYDLLLKAQLKAHLVNAVVAQREYSDMVITRVAKPRTIEDGSAAHFQVDLREMRVSDSQTVEAPQPTEARGHVAVSKGSQNGKLDPNAAAKEEQYRSMIDRMGGGDAFANLIRSLRGAG